MLAVIDYGAGNLRSVIHALNYLGAENLRVVRTPHELRGTSKIILPGVGAFGAGMNQLRAHDLVNVIRDSVFGGTPYLGICLGMQFLFDSSDEMGDHAGLGILRGRVTRFADQPGFKVPHIGWNQLQLCREAPLMNGISESQYAFFVHSYYCVPDTPSDILIKTEYGISFTSGVQHQNIYGVQFHPEKSQRTGLQLLKNFLELSL